MRGHERIPLIEMVSDENGNSTYSLILSQANTILLPLSSSSLVG